jgi:Trk K+ transport system NAD-binding subunit
VFSPALYRATFLTLMARNPNMFDLLVSTKDERDLLEMVVKSRYLEGRLIRDLALPTDSLILSVVRDGEMIIPHGNTRLEYDDQVSILIDKAHIQMLIHMFSPNDKLRNEII